MKRLLFVLSASGLVLSACGGSECAEGFGKAGDGNCYPFESDTDTELDDEEEDEEEQIDENGNLVDLVAPERDVELFTRASGTEHAETMNRAQEEFEAWVPANESEQRTKDMIDSIDGRIRRAEQARAWSQGRVI